MSKRSWAIVVAVGLTALPLIVMGALALRRGDFALNTDVALIELRVRDIGSHTPLVGSYQRYGFNQPGPSWFYYLFFPYKLAGSRFSGLQLGVVITNIAAIVAMAVVTVRRGGTVLLLWSLVLVAVLVRALGTAPLSDPWEPHAGILPCALLFLLAADAASGRVWAVPAAAIVATVMAQAYAVLAPVAVALFAWSLIAVAVRFVAAQRRGRPIASRRTLVRAGLITVGLLAVLWAPPVLEAFRGHPGNFQAMWKFFRAPHHVVGLGHGWSTVTLQLDHRAPWFRGDTPLVPFTTQADVASAAVIPIALVALVAACGVAMWRRSASLAFGLTALFTVAASTLALSRLIGDIFVWILQWTRAIGMACWLAAGWCAWSSVPDRARARARPVVLAALGVVLVGLTAVNVGDALEGPRSQGLLREAVLDVRGPAVQAARSAGGPVLVSSTVDVSAVFGAKSAGLEFLALALDRAGVDVVVDASLANRYGKHRAEPGRAVTELRLSTGSTAPRGFTAIETVDVTGRSAQKERTRLLEALRQRVGSISLAELRRRMASDHEVKDLATQFAAVDVLPPLTLSSKVLRSR